MDKDLEEIRPLIKIRNISTELEDLGKYLVKVLREDGTSVIVPVNSLSEYDYVKDYIRNLKAHSNAMDLVVDKLTAKEEKQENKDKWVNIHLKSKYGNVVVKLQDIDFLYYNSADKKYELHLKDKDTYYYLSQESYEELTKLLVGNKEIDNV